MADQPTHMDRLVHLAFQMLFPDRYPTGHPERVEETAGFTRLRQVVESAWEQADEDDRRALRMVRRDISSPVSANPDGLRMRLLWRLAEPRVAAMSLPGPAPGPDEVPEHIQYDAVHLEVGSATEDQRAEIESWFNTVSTEGGHVTEGKGSEMSDESKAQRSDEAGGNDGNLSGNGNGNGNGGNRSGNGNDNGDDWNGGDSRFDFDTRGLPDSLKSEDGQDAYRNRIKRLFRQHGHPLDDSSARNHAHAAYVVGALVRASYFEPDSPGFFEAFIDEFNEGYDEPETLPDRERQPQTTIDVYHAVVHLIRQLKGSMPTYQEVAAVSDEVLKRGPVNDNLEAKVRSAHDDFVSNAPVYDSLELPDLVTEDTAKGDVEPVNIRSVAMIYAATHLEPAISAVDQAAQDWTEGVLPVGDSAGRLFDPYVWDARDRLDAAARQIQYDRITELKDYLLRFCSATSERERGLYLSEYLTGPNQDRRSPQPGDATVRKTARDLLAYASLHGWAYTQFAAKRLGNHIRQCVEILEHPEVQKAYGVQGEWQVVERISSMTTGSTPNLTKELTLASTGKAIVDLLAAKAKDIAAHRSASPMFPPPGGDFQLRDGSRASVFSRAEYRTLLAHMENWLAANAITDTERFTASQPQQIAGTPSLPNLGFDGFGGSNGFQSSAVKDQLMQMVSAGQMPTVDQVNQLFRTQN